MQYDNDSVYRVYLSMPDTYEVEVHNSGARPPHPAQEVRYMGRENLPLWMQEKIAMLDIVAPKGLLTGIGTVHTSANSDRIYWIGAQDAKDVGGRAAPFDARYVENKQDGRCYLQQLHRPWYTITTTVSSQTHKGLKMIDKVLSYVMTALAGIGVVSLLFAGMILMTPQPKTHPVSLNNPTPCELKGGENAVEQDGKCFTKKGREIK